MTETDALAVVPQIQNYLAFGQSILKSGFAPTHYKNPESIVAAILLGREVGFGPMQALQSINVIQGKPTIDAGGLKAIVQAHGVRIKTIEWTDKKCTLELVRGDHSDKFTFTMDDAAQMGLVGKDNWKRMPKFMLYARCVSTLIRNNCADLIRGFYSKEEMEDTMPAVVTEVTPQAEPIVTAIPAPEEDCGAYVIQSECGWKGKMVSELAAKPRTWAMVQKVLEDKELSMKLCESDITALKSFNQLKGE